MLLTEEEAKRKTCLLAPRIDFCIASSCMAWREVRSGNVDNPMREPNKGFGTKLIGGYCGLAGIPYPSW